MGTNWKNRSTYGNILKRKIIRLDKVLKGIAEKEEITEKEMETYLTISKVQDYSIQVQLSNIKRVEDFEILERMERIEHDRRSSNPALQESETAITDRIFR